ncbi:MAG: multiheme c-type cytochrome [Nitrospirota bacterium]
MLINKEFSISGVFALIILFVIILEGGLFSVGLTQENEVTPAWIEDIDKAFPRAEKCKQCHESHYSEWKGSRLESSLTEPIFKVMLGIWLKTNPTEEAKRACLSCHIPSIKAFPQYTEKVISQVLTGNVRVEGVGCSGCHLINSFSSVKSPPADIGYKLGDTYFGPYSNAEENLAHKSESVGVYSSSEYCTACHFDKLQQPGLGSGDMITKEIVCQRCHMGSSVGKSAKGGPMRSIADHSFTGGLPAELSGRSRANIINEWLYKLEADIERRGDEVQIAANIKAGEIAHTLPAEGDPLFKEFILTISVRDQDGKEVFKGDKIYTRRFKEILNNANIAIETILRNGETRKVLFNFKVPDSTKRLEMDLLLTYSLISQPDPDLLDRYLGSLPSDEKEEAKKLIAEYRRSYTLAHLFKSY